MAEVDRYLNGFATENILMAEWQRGSVSLAARRKEMAMKNDDWRQPIQRHAPLKGQRLLFGDERIEVKRQVDEWLVDDLGRRFLSDYGHGLPGAAETDQMLIWDV